VDSDRFNPERRDPDRFPAGALTVLYTGGSAPASGTDLLADAFLIARNHLRRLHLVHIAEPAPAPDDRARLFASAHLLVLPGAADASSRTLLEAQASGLPVIAVDSPAASELVVSGRNGCLVPPDPLALADAICGLARRETLRRRLSAGGLLAARERTWERSLSQLADAYARALTLVADEPIAHAA
jgi:glycosyltransferase involved in cell wall biosynthesis